MALTPASKSAVNSAVATSMMSRILGPVSGTGAALKASSGPSLGLPGTKGKKKKTKSFFDHLNEITAIMEAISAVADNVFNTADRVTERSKKLRSMYDTASADVTSRAKRIGNRPEEEEDEETSTKRSRRARNRRSGSKGNRGRRSRNGSEDSNQRGSSRPGRGR